MPGSQRRGAVLIEVVIGMTVIATSGVALLSVLGQAQAGVRSVRQTERAYDSASSMLDAVSLLDRQSLIERIGSSMSGPWVIDIIQRSPDLFDVGIARANGRVLMLETTFYRPDSAHAE